MLKLAAMVEFKTERSSIDAAYIYLALETGTAGLPLQYLYLGGNSQFHISLLQMMHLL